MTTPMPAPPFVPGAVLRSPVKLGRATAVLLSVVAAADVFGCYADLLERNVAGDVADGARGVGVVQRADHADAVYAWAGFVQEWALVATAVVYLCWLWRVRVNAEVFDQSAHDLGRGWTIGAWFCPIVNLWFPRRIVLNVWDASVPWGEPYRHRAVNAWWTLWIISILTSWLAYTSWGQAHTARLLYGAAGQMLFSDMVDSAAAVLAIVVVVRLTRMQDRKALAGPLPAPVLG
ncbi:uncharacterized protein DUF4328 [Streptomyces puniciscabiei]|uniref:Uncharacterized protein DUF4328 n=1 Tax=Streptomyces puniciscabiei TaxID=164348 RepID=A0A542UD31_9ACTN|nr:DUF4328 domain-containing protein [Streptomyces puniciscabiei]TQK96977.1 uncharacterized protein DUF4328 [Streptomyces puniciscabiei]